MSETTPHDSASPADRPTREVRTVLTGRHFTECPRWHDDRWYFVDFYSHTVHSMAADGSDLGTELEVPQQPSGLGWLPDGRLLVVSMKDRRILRREHDGTVVEHADLSELAAGHVNDMVVDDKGRAYVGNFGFDLFGEDVVVPTGLILVEPDGSSRVVAEGLYFPNGSVITPDNKTLLVNETFSGRVSAFDIHEDGSLGPRRDWATFGEFPESLLLEDVMSNGVPKPDGCGLDADGNLWVADACGGPVLHVAVGGEILERLDAGAPVFACLLGGPDGRDLFLSCAPDFDEDARTANAEATIRFVRADVPHGGQP
ncbi:MAG: SMP-30/gluconolactonase/LRE family protein [Candidatus Corynebacterium faecigallinarum]